MKKLAIILSLLALMLPSQSYGDELADLKQTGQKLIKQFATELQSELKQAIASGGPVSAIEVCYIKAPEIADNVSTQSNWTIGRSSHKLRSPSNEPDNYTRLKIAEFLDRESDGEKAETMVSAEIIEDGNQRVFRMTKAIPTQQVCLACHGGDAVKPEVEAAILSLYPDDLARDFKLGEMRGVFNLSKELN